LQSKHNVTEKKKIYLQPDKVVQMDRSQISMSHPARKTYLTCISFLWLKNQIQRRYVRSPFGDMQNYVLLSTHEILHRTK